MLTWSLSLALPAASLPRSQSNLKAFTQIHAGFEENVGQAEPGVRFQARASGCVLQVRDTEAELVLGGGVASEGRSPRHYQRMRLIGATPKAPVRGLEPLPGRLNYLRGRDQRNWVRAVRSFGAVSCGGVYAGTDLRYHTSPDGLEYDFVVAPGGDPRKIQLSFDALDAARAALPLQGRINAAGDLLLESGLGEIRHRRPVAFQLVGGRRRGVPVSFRLRRTGFAASNEVRVSFDIGDYDHSRTLVIDPVLSFSTYLGGSENDAVTAVATGADGAIYAAGWTESPDFPTAFPLPTPKQGGRNAYVAKFGPGGKGLIYATFFGGAGNDGATAVRLDRAGRAVVAGSTVSDDFPLAAQEDRPLLQASHGGAEDGFLVVLARNGRTLDYATYLGGAEDDAVVGMESNSSGIWLVGRTASKDDPSTMAYEGFPVTPGVVQSAPGGSVDGFVTFLAASGGSASWSTYLGGEGSDEPAALAVDDGDRVFVAGTVRDTPEGEAKGAVTALNARGAQLEWPDSPVLDATEPAALAWASGKLLVAGKTSNANLTPGELGGPAYAEAGDGFVAVIDPGTGAVTGTWYLGGAAADEVKGIAPARNGALYVVGRTASADLPLLRALQDAKGGVDAFAARLDIRREPWALEMSTYLGDAGDDGALAAVATSKGDLLLAGITVINTPLVLEGFPLKNPTQGIGGKEDGFVAVIGRANNGKLLVSRRHITFPTIGSGVIRNQTLRLRNTGRANLMVRVGTPGAPFTVRNAAGVLAPPFVFLPPRTGIELTIRYHPLQPGAYRNVLTLDTGDQRERITLKGGAF